MPDAETLQFAGKPVVTWEPGQRLPDPASHAIRLSVTAYDRQLTFAEYFRQFLQSKPLDRLDTLLIGSWGEPYGSDVQTALIPLISAARQLPALKNLAIADMDPDECEVAWIQLGDLSALYQAFPGLEKLKIRGSDGLQLGRMILSGLDTLILENAGLPASILEQIATACLPRLEHLELWLGHPEGGCDITGAHLQQLLEALPRFPALRYLGLRNAHQADELACLLARIPLPATLETLDLSGGTLGDRGGEALLKTFGTPGTLQQLDLHFHYLSDAMMARLQQLPCQVNLAEPNAIDHHNGEECRYILLSE